MWFRIKIVFMSPVRKYRTIGLVSLIVVILTIGPTILAAKSGPPTFVFGGFLLNPIDGASYLAKMYQGWQGAWNFTLPYAANPGQSTYLFLFYLFLGHLAHLFHLPLIAVFHLARLVAIIALQFSLYYFLENTLSNPKWLTTTYVWVALVSGMGWLALLFGGFTSDFWVAEMYPFLTSYTTPHFAFGLALLLFIVTPATPIHVRPSRIPWLYALAALALAIISPFGVVVALLVLGSQLVIELWPFSHEKIGAILKSRLVWVFLAGVPLLLYDVWVVRINPVLAEWNAQNITRSPPLWDLVLSLSPFLWLAIPGAILVVKRRDIKGISLVAWAGLGLLLTYFPFSLQRRFLIGLFVPFVALAVIGLAWFVRDSSSRFKLFSVVVFGLAIPTNLIILLTGFQAIQTHDELIYMTAGENQAFDWLRLNSDPDALILAAPDTGLLIPAYTGRRVIYGHPFETPHADEAEAQVTHFYLTGDLAILEVYPVQFIFYGPRERNLNPSFPIPGIKPVYSGGGVSIYANPP